MSSDGEGKKVAKSNSNGNGKKGPTKNQLAGVPKYDAPTRDKIAQEAMASKNMANVARKWDISDQTIYRYVDRYKAKLEAAGAAVRRTDEAVPRPTGADRGAPTSGRQYGRTAAPEGSEAERLREENEELLKLVGRITLERDRLLSKK